MVASKAWNKAQTYFVGTPEPITNEGVLLGQSVGPH
jgi:hypothetical protein